MKELSFAEKIAASWKDPKIRAARLASRSKNKSWLASRHRCAVTAAKALHTNHKDTYLAGQEKSSDTMKLLFSVGEYRNEHAKRMRRICKDPKRNAKIGRAHRQGRKNGTITHKFWKYANVSNGPSKRELKVVAALQAAGLKLVHQFKVPTTWYIADICFPEHKLIVEVDGHPYHYTSKGKAHRRKRDRKLRSLGFSVMHLNQKVLDRSMDVIVNRVKHQLNIIAY